ncbi:MAG TPA: flagellar biosynthesis protein FlhA, partial [Polyangia bacterium]
MSDFPNRKGGISAQTVLTMAVVSVVGILVLPVPAPVLDALLALNTAVSVLILLIALSVVKPLDFSVFPSLLLITTLLRLGLNVATTRLILLHGGEGTGAAGHIVETFGQFAVGGSLIVGAVVFLILLVVNFSVITKGSGRIAEVAARFTLDALPGKQMSIDADLSAGAIDDREAKRRRGDLEKEIEFYGAMDGASKFVRGDAMAGLIITAINLIGGMAAGLLRDKMSISVAAETYFILTIGDGLVSQIPALLVSTASGIIITRAGTGTEFGPQIGAQIFGQPRPLLQLSAVLGALALVPGMPLLSFGMLAGLAYTVGKRRQRKPEAPPPTEAEKAPPLERLQDLIALDALELEVGHALLPLIDVAKGGELPGRVANLRKQIATDIGVVLPPVHLRDNLRLDAADYRLRLRGMEIGAGVAYADRLMLLEPSGGVPNVPGIVGITAKEPAFGLPALWVQAADRGRAESSGLTVVDAASVVTTHLSELLRKNAHELVGRQEVQELLAACGKEAPKLVEDVVPNTITLGDLVRVVRGILREGLSIRDLRTILEGVADAAPRSKDTSFLVEQVRR